MKKLLIMIMLAALALPAMAQDAPKPDWTFYLGGGGGVVQTQAGRDEMFLGRAKLIMPFTPVVTAGVRGDLTLTQDGGSLTPDAIMNDPGAYAQAFRSLEAQAFVNRRLGPEAPLSLTGAIGMTYNVGREYVSPIDPRLYTVAGMLRLDYEGGYVSAGAGHYGPVGGAALLVDAAVPAGKAQFVAQFALPINANTVTKEKTWEARVFVIAELGRWQFKP